MNFGSVYIIFGVACITTLTLYALAEGRRKSAGAQKEQATEEA